MSPFYKFYFLFGLVSSAYYSLWQVSLLGRGFAFDQLAVLVGLSSILSLALDFPTGLFADRIGHKRSCLIGVFTHCLGFSFSAIWMSSSAVVCTVIFIGLGNALINGALETWVADINKQSNYKISTRRFIALDQVQRMGMIVGAFLIPTIISLLGGGIRTPWITFFVLMALVFVVLANVKGSTAETPVGKMPLPPFVSLFEHLKSKEVMLLLGSTLVFGISDGAVSSAFWPKINQLGISEPMALGFIQGGMSLSRLFGLEIWKRFSSVNGKHVPVIALILSTAPYFVFAISNNSTTAITAWFFRISFLSIYFSSVQSWIQNYFGGTGWRATIASAVSSFTQVGTIALTLSVGIFKFSILNSNLIGATATLVSGCLFYLSLQSSKSEKI